MGKYQGLLNKCEQKQASFDDQIGRPDFRPEHLVVDLVVVDAVTISNGFEVITLFKIYLKRVMTDPFTFECHYSLLDHVKLKLQS